MISLFVNLPMRVNNEKFNRHRASSNDTHFSTTSPSPLIFTHANSTGHDAIFAMDASTSSAHTDFDPYASGNHVADDAGMMSSAASSRHHSLQFDADRAQLNGTAIGIGASGPIAVPPRPQPQPVHRPLQAMDTLKPPGYFPPCVGNAADASNSPPRSNSVDLSTLRRDIELWSISSGDVSEVGSDAEFEPPTPAESVRTVRSKSHDPTQSPDHILRRPSRIEHLSEIFRYTASLGHCSYTCGTHSGTTKASLSQDFGFLESYRHFVHKWKEI